MSEEYLDQEAETPDTSYLIKKVDFPIKLPCGYVDREGKLHTEVEFARMTGVEEDLLTDESKLKDGKNIRQILSNCLTRVGNITAPYGKARDSKQRAQMEQVVENLLIADKTFLIVMLRRVSLMDGDFYRFNTTCQNPQCHKEFLNKLDLGELRVIPMPDPDAREFLFKMPVCGSVVRYRHLYVHDEPRLGELARRFKDRFMSAVLWAQIIDIDGNKVQSHVDLQQYCMADRDALREDMQDHEGGLDMGITMECPTCGNIVMQRMDIEPSFFIPSALGSKQKASKRK